MLENKLQALEKRTGTIIAAIVVAFVLLLIAAVYVRPAVSTVALGKWYATFSLDPFSDAPNRVGYRILTPLISYLVGLRGELIIVTNLFFAFSFLAAAYWYFRQKLEYLTDSLYATAVFAFSLITLTTIYYGGYCDSLTYLLVLLMWIFRGNMPLFSVLFLLGLLNRESIVFLLPWFLYLHVAFAKNKVKSVIAFFFCNGLALVAYYFYREWIFSIRQVDYGVDYYLSPLKEDLFGIFKKSLGYQWLGIFTVFKSFWLIVLLATWSFWKQRSYKELISITILILCVWGQQFIAWDSSRMMTLCFPIMLVSLQTVFKENTLEFRRWAFLLMLFNFIVPQLYTAGYIIERMNSTIYTLLKIVIFDKPGW